MNELERTALNEILRTVRLIQGFERGVNGVKSIRGVYICVYLVCVDIYILGIALLVF